MGQTSSRDSSIHHHNNNNDIGLNDIHSIHGFWPSIRRYSPRSLYRKIRNHRHRRVQDSIHDSRGWTRDVVDQDDPLLPDNESIISRDDRHRTILLNPGYRYRPNRYNLQSNSTTPVLPHHTSSMFRRSIDNVDQPDNDTQADQYLSQLRRALASTNNTTSGNNSTMDVQFETLSNLLETVTMGTLRRLLQEGPNDTPIPTTEEGILQRYHGSRIDEPNLPNSNDTSFEQFLNGLRTHELLQRELGSQMNAGGNLSFFRAFRFEESDTNADPNQVIPVMIIGLVSINHGSASSSPSTISADNIISQTNSALEPAGIPLNGDSGTLNDNSSDDNETNRNNEHNEAINNPYRSWIIVVIAHHYAANDSVLDSMPLFINLLRSYVSHADGLFQGSTNGSVNSDEFRNSLFRLFSRSHGLSRNELSQHTDTLCVFKKCIDGNTSWREKAKRADLSANESIAYFDPGDHCPICMTEYTEGDEGRKLNCKHAFHKSCIDEWLTNDNTCPICRAKAL